MNRSISAAQRQTFDQLAQQVRSQESWASREDQVFASDCQGLDALLPHGAFRRGSLVEWLATSPGCGAAMVAAWVARAACAAGGRLAIIDTSGTFYPPSLFGWSGLLDRALFITPSEGREALWTMDQVLRCPSVAAVLAWPKRIDSHTFRRWQLAAEQSGVVGLLVRPAAARHEPSWADVRLSVAPCLTTGEQRRLRIERLYARGSLASSNGNYGIEVLVNHETHTLESVSMPTRSLPLASQLAHPAVAG
jgi:hypothetical protein